MWFKIFSQLGWVLWSGHSRWLFSCSLYICLTKACFMYMLFTWLILLHTCSGSQLVIISNQRGVRACAGFPGNWVTHLISIPAVTGNQAISPSPLKDSSRVLPTLYCAFVGCCSRTLPETCKLPHPLNHWYLFSPQLSKTQRHVKS